MVDLFDTHKFLFTLNYEKRIKGHKVIFEDRDGEEKEAVIDKIDIGTSPIKCKIHEENGISHTVAYLRIREIYLGEELVWTNEKDPNKTVKVIKGHK